MSDVIPTDPASIRVRKRPVEVEAWRWHGQVDLSAAPEWLRKASGVQFELAMFSADWLMGIPTLEGTHWACEGDWIIRGIKGELYSCKHDIFEATYERV